MKPIAYSAIFLLVIAVLSRQIYQIKEKEGFIDYIVVGPGPGPGYGFYGRGPWYGGRWRYQPWWGYRNPRGWWNTLYEPAPWGPCPGPWCPYR